MFGDEPRVADHQHTAIVLVADQSTGTLLQCDYRLWKLILHEGVAAFRVDRFDARGQHRIVRRCERQAIDNHQRQRFTAHVHTLPERLAAQQYRIAQLAEALQQFRARSLALHEQRIIHAHLLHARCHQLACFTHRPQAGEQEKRATLGCFDHGQRRIDRLARIAFRVRLRQPLGHVEQRLIREVERAFPECRGGVP